MRNFESQYGLPSTCSTRPAGRSRGPGTAPRCSPASSRRAAGRPAPRTRRSPVRSGVIQNRASAAASPREVTALPPDFFPVLEQHDVRPPAGQARMRDARGDGERLADEREVLRRDASRRVRSNPFCSEPNVRGVERRAAARADAGRVEHAPRARRARCGSRRSARRPPAPAGGPRSASRRPTRRDRSSRRRGVRWKLVEVDVGRTGVGKRPHADVESLRRSSTISAAERTPRRTATARRVRRDHAARGVDQHRQQRLTRRRRDLAHPRRVQQHRQHQRHRRRHQPDDRPPPPPPHAAGAAASA